MKGIQVYYVLSLILFLAFSCKTDKSQDNSSEPVVKLESAEASKVKTNPVLYDPARVNELLDRSESKGFADGNQGRKDTIIEMIKSLQAYDHVRVGELATASLEKADDEDIKYIYQTSLGFAARSIVWKGGTPGKETSWNEPRNWDKNEVPDEDSRVVIKSMNTGHNAQPVIKDPITVNAVEIHPNAKLVIASTGQLVIDGEYFYSEGISIMGGKLESEGRISLRNIDANSIMKVQPTAVNEKTGEFYSEKYGYSFTVVD